LRNIRPRCNILEVNRKPLKGGPKRVANGKIGVSTSTPRQGCRPFSGTPLVRSSGTRACQISQ
jgi:hypothetical protein